MRKKSDILNLKKHQYEMDKYLIRELMIVSLPMALQYSIRAIGVMIL